MKTSEISSALSRLYDEFVGLRDGNVATYIPELSNANPEHFAIAVADVDGGVFAIGDADIPFTIQSISKPFVLGLALEDLGREAVAARVGVEPTGESFNSISLDGNSNRPKNPMINAGAIAITSLIRGDTPAEKLKRVLSMFESYVGSTVYVDSSTYISERTSGDRNRAIAYLMRNFGIIHGDIDSTLDLYFQQCSVLMTCRQLAIMAATLANKGLNPVTQLRVLRPDLVRDVLSIMFTCGLYDSSGEWAYRVGLPAKSGVGGGLLAVAPGLLGIAVYSPLLDRHGHSVRGLRVCRALSESLNLSIFS